LYSYSYLIWALGITKIVLVAFVVGILASFGVASTVQFAEGAVGWNSFLKEIGFNPPTVYEVSANALIPKGDNDAPVMQLLCLDGDYLNEDILTIEGDDTGLPVDSEVIAISIQLIRENPDSKFTPSKPIGFSFRPLYSNPAEPPPAMAPFDIEVTITILCLSPSSFQTVGGTLIATDNVALAIGYSVLNAYWIAPTAIGFGLGLYLIKKRF